MKPRNSFKFILFTVFLLVSLFAVPTALAFEASGDGNVTIAADEVITDDLYTSGERVVVDGTIQGDLIVAGSEVVINGTVTGDLIAAGKTVSINGSIGDDARVAGYAVTIGSEAQIGDDLLSAGYSVETRSGSQVGGTMAVGAMQALVNGSIAENLYAGVNGLELNGNVNGDVRAEVGSKDDMPPVAPNTYNPDLPSVPTVSGGFTLGSEASIGGNLEYSSVEAIQIPTSQVAGVINHTVPLIVDDGKPEAHNQTPAASPALEWLLSNLRSLTALLVVGFLLMWLLPFVIQRPANQLTTQWLPGFGWGFALYIIIPIGLLILFGIVILLAVLMGALSLGNLAGTIFWVGFALIFLSFVAFFLTVIYLAKLVVAYETGKLLLNRFKPEWTEKPYIPLALGIFLLVALVSIPIAGGLVNFIATLLGLGLLFIALRNRTAPQTQSVVVSETL